MSLPFLSILVAVTAGIATVLLCAAMFGRRGLRWSDLPFVFFLGLALVYLQLSPSLAMVSRSLPGIDARGADYVRIQGTLFLAVLVPLVVIYCWRRPTSAPSDNAPFYRPDVRRVPWDAVLLTMALCRLAIAWRYGLWQLRIGDEVAEKTNAVPFLVYSFYRLLVEAQLPAVTASAVRLVRVRSRRSLAAFCAFVTVQMLFALLNSRFSILYLFVAIVFGAAIGLRPTISVDRRVRRVAIAAVLAVYVLGLAVLQLRASTGDPSVSSATTLSVLGDSQGFNRFNCVDLVAAIAPQQRQTAAGVKIWRGQLWNFRRFVDPEGFADFRETLVTSAKSQLILRYQGVRQSDYYSCMLTDTYGALGAWGAVLLSTVCALALRAVRVLTESRRLPAVFVGIWLAWQIMVFEQEGGSLLFSWPLKLPLLLGLLVAAVRLSPRRHQRGAPPTPAYAVGGGLPAPGRS